MNYRKVSIRYLLPVLSLMVLISCHEQPRKVEKDNVKTPAQMDEHVGGDLKTMLQFAMDNRDQLNDSTFLNYRKLLDSTYENNDYTPLWSDKEHWLAPADSLFTFIADSK